MSYFIGIDGGGTKTKCSLVNEKLKVLSQSESSASNPMVIGIEKSAMILFDLICDTSLKINVKEIDSVVIGIAGGGRKNIADKLKHAVINLSSKKKISLKNLIVVSDAEIAVEGAFAGNSGVILIAGTGSIIFGKDGKGKVFRAGGYGRIIGDPGSGYSIGKKALQKAAAEIDENVKQSFLLNLLEKKYSIKTRDELILKVYTENFDIANLAEFIINGAGKGNKVCRIILKEEIDSIIQNLLSFKKIFTRKNFDICLSGGLLKTENYYSKNLKREIKNNFKEIKLKRAEYLPEIGAAILAMKSCLTK